MTFHIISLFPKAFESYLGESIIKRAIEDKKIKVNFYNPRDYVPVGKRSFLQGRPPRAIRIDKPPYGGGPGMVVQALPVIKAIEVALAKSKFKNHPVKSRKAGIAPKVKLFNRVKIIWLTPSGKQFTNLIAKNYSQKFSDLIIICGRYEGIDARVKKIYKVEEISVGPFVLTGGELPAMIVMDAVSRQIKGVLGKFDSLEERRISSSDVYTRPEVLKYKGKSYKVPKVLLSGHHKKIEMWKGKKR